MIKWCRPCLFLTTVLLTVLLITGCASIGPGRVQRDRVQYNDVVQETDNEQLLKNIVRLRYFHSTNYLAVTNVTSTYNLNRSLAATNVTQNSSTTNLAWPSLGLTPTVTYSDSPTISYAPLTNGDFIRSMQRSVSFDDFVLLSQQPPIEQGLLITLLTQKIGNVDANISIANNTAYESEEYDRYIHYFNVLRKMLSEKTITLTPYVFNKQPALVLQFKQGLEQSANALTLKKIVNVPSNSPSIILMAKENYDTLNDKSGFLVPETAPKKPSNVVYVQLRSISATLQFVARGVNVPHIDLDKNLALKVCDYQGNFYPSDPFLNSILTIYNSDTEPVDNVLVKTYVNHHWFYIEDSDSTSKITFDLLIRLILLTATMSAEQQGPALTLPIGG